MRRNKRILVIVPGRELLGKLEAFLNRSSLEVNHVTSAQSSLILTNNLSYDLILAEHPMADLGLGEFLASIRSADSPSARCPLLLFAEEERIDALATQLDGQLDHVLPATVSGGEIERTISRVLGVAARSASRILVRLEVELNPGKLLRACQTVNISTSGMLVRIRQPIAVGTELGIRFNLPGDGRAIEATARVVRHSAPDVEGLRGVGLQLLDLTEDAQDQLAAFVNEQLSERSHSDAAPRRSAAGA